MTTTLVKSPPPPVAAPTPVPARRYGGEAEPVAGIVTRFPGGAIAQERGRGIGWTAIALIGELDAFDRYAIVDVLSYYVLGGCLNIHIDATDVTFIDVRALRSFDRVRRAVERQGGSLSVTGLRPVSRYVWERVAGIP